MDAREKLNEFAELRGWDKNKLIGWSEAADFGEWLVKNCSIPAVSNSLLDLDGKTIPVTFRVSKYEPKIDIDFSNDC